MNESPQCRFTADKVRRDRQTEVDEYKGSQEQGFETKEPLGIYYIGTSCFSLEQPN